MSAPDYYATLGLDRRCTTAQVRAAYRILAKQFHPDVNDGSPIAETKTQELNAAYEILNNPELRRAYDKRETTKPRTNRNGNAKVERNISQEVHLRLEDFFRGTTLEVRVNDPANSQGVETYQLTVPPETAPGTRFRLPRAAPFEGGFIAIRVRAMPGFRFKVRGSDLRCDLRIQTRRAAEGGLEMIVGPTGVRLPLQIPRRVARGEILCVSGEGLPKSRGGRGNLLVRITYSPEVHVARPRDRSA